MEHRHANQKPRRTWWFSALVAFVLAVVLVGLPVSANAEEASSQQDAPTAVIQGQSLTDSSQLIGAVAVAGASQGGTDASAYSTRVAADDTFTLKGKNDYDTAKKIVDLVNVERKKAGLGSVAMDASLTEAAMQRATEISLNFDHTRPDGSSFRTVSSKAWGENIAVNGNLSTAQTAMTQWMNSAGHKANILTSSWKSMGVGVFRWGGLVYFVQLFSTSPASGSIPSGSPEKAREVPVSYSVVPTSGAGFNLNMFKTNPIRLAKGKTYQLEVGVPNPGWSQVYMGVEASSFTWTSSNPAAVSVSSTGLVTANAEQSGKVTITAKSKHGSLKVSYDFRAMDEPLSMYRLYNKYTGEHLYTSNVKEYTYLSSVGWNDEGTGWYAPKKSNTPVYRLYNRYSGDHHYTTSKAEYEALGKAGWNKEGVAWYSDDAKGVPLYRQFNPYAKIGTHNYTESKAENDKLVKLGWKAEGIAWYGVSMS